MNANVDAQSRKAAWSNCPQDWLQGREKVKPTYVARGGRKQ